MRRDLRMPCMLLVVIASGLSDASAQSIQGFVGTVDDHYTYVMKVEIESPLAEGKLLPAGERRSTGSRSTTISKEGEVRVLNRALSDWASETATQGPIAVPIATSQDEDRTVRHARRIVDEIDTLDGALPCKVQPGGRAPCGAFSNLLPLPPLNWEVIGGDADAIRLEAKIGDAQGGLAGQLLSGALIRKDRQLEWSVISDTGVVQQTMKVTDAPGNAHSVHVPTRTLMVWKGTRTVKHAQ